MSTPTPNLEQAFREELPFLRALAQRLTAAPDADDLVQDAWIDASAAEIAGARSWRSYFSVIVRNRARMQARADVRRRRREALADPSEPTRLPDAASALAEVLRRLADELDRLPAAERALLQARFVEGRSSTEIGSAHGLDPATVRSRIRRSLDRLRSAMDARHEGRRAEWAWAMAPMFLPVRPSTSTVVMTMTAKTMIGVGALAGAIAAWTATRDRVAVDVAPPVVRAAGAEPTAARAIEAPPATAVDAPAPEAAIADREHDRRAWNDKRARIREARRQPAPTEPDAPTDFPDEGLRAVTDAMPAELGPLFQSLTEQIVEVLPGCTELVPEDAGGKITLRAHVISEPDVGTIVESVDTVEDSIGAEALERCMSESIYAFDLASPLQSVTREFSFTIDLDERSLSANTNVTMEQLQEMIAKNPDIAEQAEVAAALAEAEAQANAAAPDGT